jgi:hypothetical protein
MTDRLGAPRYAGSLRGGALQMTESIDGPVPRRAGPLGR